MMCAVETCPRFRVSRGWCRRHYQRWQKYGDPRRERPNLAERLEQRMSVGPGCHVWLGARDTANYGVITVGGKQKKVSRVVWELNYGAIPAGLYVCHSCDNPPCARPDHLMLGTQRANIQDMLAKGRRQRKAA